MREISYNDLNAIEDFYKGLKKCFVSQKNKKALETLEIHYALAEKKADLFAIKQAKYFGKNA